MELPYDGVFLDFETAGDEDNGRIVGQVQPHRNPIAGHDEAIRVRAGLTPEISWYGEMSG